MDVEKIALQIESKWLEAENRIMEDIIRRIRKTGRITSTADHQINRLIELGKSTEEIERHLQKALNYSNAKMYELYDEVVNWEYVRNEKLYLHINSNFIAPEDNMWLRQVSSAIKSQTAAEFKNMSGSYGFAVKYGKRTVYMPFAEYWQKYVDAAITDMLSGAFDSNTVIRRTVTQMTNSGLRTVPYGTGYNHRTNVAARKAILTGVNQISRKISEQTAKELGTDTFEISYHSGHRPDHWWGGMVYSYADLMRVCGLGEVTGLCGANCYHAYYPFVPGVSQRTYSDQWIAEQEALANQTKTWNGKDYNAYNAQQMQRKMETNMRAQREKVNLLRTGNGSVNDINIARAKYRSQLYEYTKFCGKMGVKQQRERIYADMLGRIA